MLPLESCFGSFLEVVSPQRNVFLTPWLKLQCIVYHFFNVSDFTLPLQIQCFLGPWLIASVLRVVAICYQCVNNICGSSIWDVKTLK